MGETRHQTSLAVWDVPTAVVTGERFIIKAGVKSSADCDLHGCRVEACDPAGTVIASGTLGATPWPGTAALYWTELSLPAPPKHGLTSLSVRFAAASLAPPHRDASARFDVVVEPPPAHTLTIDLVVADSGQPIGGAEIRVGAHRTTTTESGQVKVRLPKGRYNLHVWKVGFDAPPRTVDIDADAAVQVAALVVPEENADRAWKM